MRVAGPQNRSRLAQYFADWLLRVGEGVQPVETASKSDTHATNAMRSNTSSHSGRSVPSDGGSAVVNSYIVRWNAAFSGTLLDAMGSGRPAQGAQLTSNCRARRSDQTRTTWLSCAPPWQDMHDTYDGAIPFQAGGLKNASFLDATFGASSE